MLEVRGEGQVSLGLAELVARSRPDECPFCGEPRAASPSKPNLTCGDEVCKRAYRIYYGRDRVRPKLTRAQKDENNRKKREKYALASRAQKDENNRKSCERYALAKKRSS